MHSVDIRCNGNQIQTIEGKEVNVHDIACMTIEDGKIRDVVLKEIWEREDFISWLNTSEYRTLDYELHMKKLIREYKKDRGIE